ncbi:consortin [Conger conger]|uniref:consortin n=1 Tax=Conger conger TaxID=82655 RepID=UPI002A5AEC24|nr:consortin [Conger conger]XP_061105861.1 consortin [Conger conger]
MDEGLSRGEEVVRPAVLGGSGIGDGELCNSVGYGAPSPASSDENQNRLREDELEGQLRGGQELFRQDSMNNNEEMDNRPCPSHLDTRHKDRSTAGTQHTTDTDVPGGSPPVCPLTGSPDPLGDKEGGSPQSTSAPDLSSAVALLRELQGDGDHPRLPQRLHQIAEVYFLEEDYEQALQFIQLERLYQERLLSNLAALQEHCESRWKAGHQGGSQPQGQAQTDLRSAPLETLSQICRTHQRPSLSADKHKALNSRTRTGEDAADGTLLPCSAHGAESGRLMEERQASEELHPALSAEDVPTPDHQRAPLCNSDSSAPLLDAPASPVPTGHDSASGDGKKEPGGEDQPTDVSLSAGPDLTVPLGVDPETEECCGSQSDTELTGVEEVTPETGDEKGESEDTGQVSPAGEDPDLLHTEGLEVLEGEEEEEDIPEEDFEDDEFGDETVVVPGVAVASLDEMAKRIKVEQTAPAPGLVSILKRRSSLEGSPPQPPAPPKQAPKRKVRFTEPDDMVDPDDVGLDSCLLLLLLCMVTMVISVGGTALYCTLGDPQSSVCTDFSHNVDFYLGQVQRGVEEIRHWLSPGS